MKTALLFGSTGLVGGYVLDQLIQNDNYSKIKIFVRSSIQINSSKIEVIQTDFNNLEKHKEKIVGDECYFCIGTTKKNTPDKNSIGNVTRFAKAGALSSFGARLDMAKPIAKNKIPPKNDKKSIFSQARKLP